MYKKINKWQAATLLCLGTMGYTALGMAADAQQAQAQQPINQAVDQAQPQYIYEDNTVNYSKKNIVNDIREKHSNNIIKSVPKSKTSNQGTTAKGPTNTAPQTLYPSFSKEEIVELENQANQNEQLPIIEEPVVTDPEQAKKDEQAYIEKNSQLYRKLPPNPAYNFGVDKNNNGACVGTEDYCTKVAAMISNLEAQVANEKGIIVTEGANKGELVMPAAFTNNVEEMPHVTKSCSEMGQGYYYDANGNCVPVETPPQ